MTRTATPDRPARRRRIKRDRPTATDPLVRIAVAFVPRGRGRLDYRPLRPDEFDLLALLAPGPGRAVAILAAYDAVPDASGGRVRFEPRRIARLEAGRRGLGIGPRLSGQVDDLIEAIEDAPAFAGPPAVAVPRFYARGGPGDPVAVGDPAGGEDAPIRIGRRPAWPIGRGGRGPIGAADSTFAIFTAGLQDRIVRSPTWGVLRSLGLARGEFGPWPYPGSAERGTPIGSRPETRPGPPGWAGPVRAALESYLGGRVGRQEALMGRIRRACREKGVALPADPTGQDDALVAMLESPWEPARAAGRGAVQVVELGPEAGGWRLENDAVVVDLGELRKAGEASRGRRPAQGRRPASSRNVESETP